MPNQPSKISDWEKEWDNKFFKFHEIGAIEHSEEMKPFIKNLLEIQRTEVLEEVEGLVKALKDSFDLVIPMTEEKEGELAMTILILNVINQLKNKEK
mgnify:CR=1 FL=1